MIPKIIHFIYPVTEKTRPWSLVNTLAVRKALEIYPDYEINIWTNKPSQVPYSERVATKFCDLPTHIGGAEIFWPQYVSDVMRLQILFDQGGVYMDTDILSLKPYDFEKEDKLIISWETPNCKSISNAMMAAPPNNLFISQWLEKMPEAMTSTTWAYGGVVLPRNLAMQPYLVSERTIKDYQWCCPFDFTQSWLFETNLKDEAKEKCKDSHAIHVFETYWRDIVKNVTPEWCEQNDCLFSEVLKNTTTRNNEGVAANAEQGC